MKSLYDFQNNKGVVAPTRVIIVNPPDGFDPSSVPLGQIAHAYDRFKLCKRGLDYLVRQYDLEDGTKLRIESNMGNDRIFVSNISGSKLPHGFVVTSNWQNPVFYKHILSHDDVWKFSYSDSVPQAKDGIKSYENLLRFTESGSLYSVPIVVTENVKHEWDWADHHMNVENVGKYVVPITFKGTNADVNPHYALFATDCSVYTRQNVLSYTFDPPPAITDDEPLKQLPAMVSGDGEHCGVQAMRVASVAVTQSIYTYRILSQKLQMLDGVVSPVSSMMTDLVVPKHVFPASSVFTSSDDLGEKPEDDIFIKRIDGQVGSSWETRLYTINSAGQWVSYVVIVPVKRALFGYYEIDYALQYPLTKTKDAISWTLVETLPEPDVVDSALLIAEAKEVSNVKLEFATACPVYEYFRGGYSSAAMDSQEFGTMYTMQRYGVASYLIRRADSQYKIDISPNVKVKTTWGGVNLFEGKVYGELSGHRYLDSRTFDLHLGSLTYWDYIVAQQTTEVPPDEAPYIGLSQYNFCVANALPVVSDLLAAYGPEPGGTKSEWRTQDPQCVGNYDVKSRYVIDFDNRAEFYAAILVEIKCDTVTWSQVPDQYEGYLRIVANPTYTISIKFEAKWNGEVIEKTLATATSTRPPFEYRRLTRTNVYVYPASDRNARFDFWMPPVFEPSGESFYQLENFALHQGVNTNLVSEDRRPDISDDEYSDNGITYSTINGGMEYPNKKRIKGMLYARTFKIGDFPQGLWLFSATKCDASAGDSILGDKWYYLPDLKNTIDNTKFHIEIRDGEFVNWSDDLTPAADKVIPDIIDREIKLYEV